MVVIKNNLYICINQQYKDHTTNEIKLYHFNYYYFALEKFGVSNGMYS